MIDCNNLSGPKVDLFLYERNRYWRFLSPNVKHYLSRITERYYKILDIP